MSDAGLLSTHKNCEMSFNLAQLFRLNLTNICMYVELTYRILIKSLYAALHSAAVVFSVSCGFSQKIPQIWLRLREAQTKVKTSQEKKVMT